MAGKPEHKREWYERNKEQHKARVRTRQLATAECFRDYKKTLSCEVCGESHPGCLDFHHRDSEDKVKDVSQMVHNGLSRKTILTEIIKCDVLCANCHRKLHYRSA